jgi:hypothetical protein
MVAIRHIAAGKRRVIATTDARRSGLFPDH